MQAIFCKCRYVTFPREECVKSEVPVKGVSHSINQVVRPRMCVLYQGTPDAISDIIIKNHIGPVTSAATLHYFLIEVKKE
jgi:hypothetical protein